MTDDWEGEFAFLTRISSSEAKKRNCTHKKPAKRLLNFFTQGRQKLIWAIHGCVYLGTNACMHRHICMCVCVCIMRVCLCWYGLERATIILIRCSSDRWSASESGERKNVSKIGGNFHRISFSARSWENFIFPPFSVAVIFKKSLASGWLPPLQTALYVERKKRGRGR